MNPGPNATKYIFVTGGVVSSLGKGIAAASLGRLLVERGLSVTMQKFDPYINVDPGRCRPSSTARYSSPTTGPRPTWTWGTTAIYGPLARSRTTSPRDGSSDPSSTRSVDEYLGGPSSRPPRHRRMTGMKPAWPTTNLLRKDCFSAAKSGRSGPEGRQSPAPPRTRPTISFSNSRDQTRNEGIEENQHAPCLIAPDVAKKRHPELQPHQTTNLPGPRSAVYSCIVCNSTSPIACVHSIAPSASPPVGLARSRLLWARSSKWDDASPTDAIAAWRSGSGQLRWLQKTKAAMTHGCRQCTAGVRHGCPGGSATGKEEASRRE